MIKVVNVISDETMEDAYGSFNRPGRKSKAPRPALPEELICERCKIRPKMEGNRWLCKTCFRTC